MPRAPDATAAVLLAVTFAMSMPFARADESPPASGQAASGRPSAQAAAREPGDASRSDWICFDVSLSCVRRATSPGPQAAPPVASHPLDLRAPAIDAVIEPAELQALLADDEPSEPPQPVETVEVEGSRPAPDVPPGLLAIPWAIRHPTQAWRIFAPIPSE